MSKYDELEKIKKLLDDGVIDSQEFEKEKSKILNNDNKDQAKSVEETGDTCKVTIHRKSGITQSPLYPAHIICDGITIGGLKAGSQQELSCKKNSVLIFKLGAGPGSETEPITIEKDTKIELEFITNSGKMALLGPFSMLSKQTRPHFEANIVDFFVI